MYFKETLHCIKTLSIKYFYNLYLIVVYKNSIGVIMSRNMMIVGAIVVIAILWYIF